MNQFPFLVLTLFVSLFAGTVSVTAQSTNQSNPTPITSNELSITGPKKNNQLYYFSFTGGPGEVTLVLSVTAKTGSTFVGIKVFDTSLNTLTYHNMSADTGSPGMAQKKFDVGEKQTLVMSFTSDSSLGECKITFSGAVEMNAAEPSTSTSASSAGPISTVTESMPNATVQSGEPMSSSGSGGTTPGKNKSFVFSILDAVGQRFNIPANGKLRIEMKDGSVQEIDLAQVKQLLIKK